MCTLGFPLSSLHSTPLQSYDFESCKPFLGNDYGETMMGLKKRGIERERDRERERERERDRA